MSTYIAFKSILNWLAPAVTTISQRFFPKCAVQLPLPSSPKRCDKYPRRVV